MSLGLLIVFV